MGILGKTPPNVINLAAESGDYDAKVHKVFKYANKLGSFAKQEAYLKGQMTSAFNAGNGNALNIAVDGAHQLQITKQTEEANTLFQEGLRMLDGFGR